MKYIDAEKLKKYIEHKRDCVCDGLDWDDMDECQRYAVEYLDDILSFITSLQQEQPDKYETALEKARKWMPNVNQGGHAILIDIFPELGEGLDPRYGGRKQEQPEADLDAEIAIYLNRNVLNRINNSDIIENFTTMEAGELARHFYELGLNARKEESK